MHWDQENIACLLSSTEEELVVTHIISTSYPRRGNQHWKEHRMQHLQLWQKIQHDQDMICDDMEKMQLKQY